MWVILGKYDELLSKITIIQEELREIKATTMLIKSNMEIILKRLESLNDGQSSHDIMELKARVQELSSLVNKMLSQYSLYKIIKGNTV